MPTPTTVLTGEALADLVRGAAELEPTAEGLVPHRLPRWAREQAADPQVLMAESQPSGVRLVLRTRAATVELDTVRTRVGYAGLPLRPDGVYDLRVDGELLGRTSTTGGRVSLLDPRTGATEVVDGPVGTVRFDGLPQRDKTVEIWLPHTEVTALVGLRADAPVEPAPADGRRTWLHHGSSISHGSGAEGPSTTWPATAARLGGVELVNLGLGGSMMLDPFAARVMRDSPADLLSIKVGINIVNADLMRVRALGPALHGFLDTVREGHPTAPLLVVSALACPIHEETPGPGAVDLVDGAMRFRATGDPAEVAAGRLTLQVVRREVERVVTARAATDPHLHHLDGLRLYGLDDAVRLPLPDGLHPDAATHDLVAQRFADLVLGPGGCFAG